MSGHRGRSADAAEVAHTARGGRRDVGGHETAVDEILVKLVVGLAAGDVEPCARLYVVPCARHGVFAHVVDKLDRGDDSVALERAAENAELYRGHVGQIDGGVAGVVVGAVGGEVGHLLCNFRTAPARFVSDIGAGRPLVETGPDAAAEFYKMRPIAPEQNGKLAGDLIALLVRASKLRASDVDVETGGLVGVV